MPEEGISQPTGGPSSPTMGEHPGIAVRLQGDAVLLCAGELDLATRPALRSSLRRVVGLTPDRVVVDLGGVSFFDAGAIDELVRARTAVRAAGGDLVARLPTPFGRRILGAFGLSVIDDAGTNRPALPSDASGHVDPLQEELVTAWEAACATDRYGAAPLVFDARATLATIVATLSEGVPVDPTARLAAPAARHDETSAATAVMQLWALSDVLHARWMSVGSSSDAGERQRRRLEAVLAAMGSAALEELEQTTLLDSLTGLLNRRALERDLPKALAAARRQECCLSVVMIDVDGLKATNDERGHAAGDDRLRGLASGLRSALRSEDTAYRIGGDEFVLVLPQLCADDVDGVMARAAEGGRSAFTWGCARVEDHDDPASDADRAVRLLEQADQRMLDHRSVLRGGHARVGGPDGRAVTPEPTGDLVGQYAAAKRSSVVIDEARGLIAEHFDTGIDQASAMLRDFSRAEDQSVQAVAEALMARVIDVAVLAAHLPAPSAIRHDRDDPRIDQAPTASG